MADEAPGDANPFDVQTIKHLVALMSRHDLNEIDLRQGQARIRLRRGAAPVLTAPLPSAPIAIAAPAAPADVAATSPPPAEKPNKAYHEIKSPGVGTFYNREKPEAAPYVARGSRVTPTTVVGLMEAMKLFSELTADCSGMIVEALVENGQAVEFGTVLYRVDTGN